MKAPRKNWLEAWHVNPSLNKDYDFIDGLRGLAILMVVACHLIYVNPLDDELVRFVGGIFSAGAFGVTLFFTLSGFLISWPFWKRKVKGSVQVVPPGYGWRRFWKIYPPLALSILLLAPIYFLRFHDPSYFKLAFEWLIGLPLLRPIDGALNPVMWSLVVEVHFYLLLPLLFLCLRKVSAKTALWTLFLLFLVVPTAWRWRNAAHGIYFTLHPQLNIHFPAMLDAFAFGILMAGLENLGLVKKSWAKLGDVGLFLLGAALILSSCLNLYQAPEQFSRELVDWFVKIGAALLLCYVADSEHPRARLLSAQWLRWCGLISYEWYLFHQPIAIWTRVSFGPAEGDPLKYLALVGGPLILGLTIAALIYRYFSLPILRQGRAKHTADKPPPSGEKSSGSAWPCFL